jgi:DNA-binding response OmpR family regulator
MRVLVVDDNPDALRTLGALLTLERHTVTLAATARLALDAAAKARFDVILLDIQMPGMSGLEIAQGIRRLAPGEKPLTIAISGRSRPDVAVLRDAGIDDFLQKPVEIEALLAMIKRSRHEPQQ